MSLKPLTAIVVSYFTGPRLKESLYALLACPDVDGILIVDNGNPPVDTQMLREFSKIHDKVSLLEAGENLGFGKANNRAAAQAPEGFLLLVNPDAVIKQDAPAKMIAASERRHAPWIVGGKIFGLDGKEGRGARRRKLTPWRALTTMAGFDTWNLHKLASPDGPVTIDAVSGALMLTDTASFKALGGFDERYFLHVEDVDICRRASEAGGTVIYTPLAGALHYGATSSVSSKVVARHKAESLARYFRKFADGPLERAAARLLIGPLLTRLMPLFARR